MRTEPHIQVSDVAKRLCTLCTTASREAGCVTACTYAWDQVRARCRLAPLPPALPDLAEPRVLLCPNLIHVSGPVSDQASVIIPQLYAAERVTHKPSWLRSGAVQGLVKVLCHSLAPPGVKAGVTLGLKHLTASSQRIHNASFRATQVDWLPSSWNLACCVQAGAVQGLVKVLCHSLAPPGVKADVTLGLKHLTASSQRNRDAFIACGGLEPLVAMLAAPSAEAQYNRYA